MIPIQILLVEDNIADVELTSVKMKQLKLCNELHVVYDGEQAIQFLRQQGEHTEAIRPDLILLDINIPRKSGLEVLEEIKQDPVLRSIPVVILTSSDAAADVNRAYHAHAAAYVQKPVDLAGYNRVVNAIDGFWFGVVKLPSGDPV